MSLANALFTCFVLFSCHALFGQIDHWETILYAEDTWHYSVDNQNVSTLWRNINFDDSSWLVGPGGIGYGDGDDQTEIDRTLSLYLRNRFELADLDRMEGLYFHADYDDAFVAYLNGEEIARSNIEGAFPGFDAAANGLREAQMYQGGAPEGYQIDKEMLLNLLQEGENVLAVQVHNFDGLNSSDMTGLFWLSVGVNDEEMEFGTVPEWFVEPEDISSELPIVRIYTNGQYIPDEPSIPGSIEIVYNGPGELNQLSDMANALYSEISIERRGQSSLWIFPKNNFGFETKDELGEDTDVSFLNFPDEEDWILHGPYSDKTFLRNALAMYMARASGQYASRTRAVELFINDNYEGVYQIMERIKRDKNRIDIASLNSDEISGDDLTGGYVIKIDKGEPDWLSRFDVVGSPGTKLTYQYVSPQASAIVPEQEAYIQSFIDSMELAFEASTGVYGGKHYRDYIDMASFIDHFLLTEISKDVDAYRLSSYFYKDKDSKGGRLKAGPVWDFNIAFGNQDDCGAATPNGYMYYQQCALANPFWWGVLLDDEGFRNKCRCRWDELRGGPWSDDAIFSYINEQADLLAEPAARNFAKWPILNQEIWPNPVVTGSYEGEINYLKDYLEARLEWLDTNLFGDCNLVSTDESNTKEISIFPNPASPGDPVFINGLGHENILAWQLMDIHGQLHLENKGNDPSIQLPTHLPDGTYVIRITTSKGSVLSTLILQH